VTDSSPTASPQKKKRVLSPEGRARIAAAAKKALGGEEEGSAK
jgi:hypothetical protein